jgi:sugar phosphate isomerase/epimerase
MGNVIACNLGSYRQFRETGYEHLAKIGLTNVEIHCPEKNETSAVQGELDRYGLTATSMIIKCQMDADDAVQRFVHSLDTVSEMGVGVVFSSVKSGGIDKDYIYGKLQDIGDAAAERSIVVAMETHPDMITNADVALATMAGVNHPNIRVNFDTANIYYYNKGVDVVEQFERVVDYVGAVHLKDTNGEFETWHFPALGEGVVDFPAIFKCFADKGANGPYTMELEGIKGEELSREGVEKRVEDSLAYLRVNGLMD